MKSTLTTAITDVFIGLLSSKLLGEDVGREARFDVFDKIIVYKDTDTKQSETSSKADNTNQILQQYIIAEMSKSKVDFIKSLNSLCEPTQKAPADDGMLSWMYAQVSSLFYAPTPQAPIDTIRQEITKDQVLSQVNEMLEHLADAETICLAVKDEIAEDFNAVNCKYSEQQITEEILPQIDALIANFTNNILAMKEYLGLNHVKEQHARLVLK